MSYSIASKANFLGPIARISNLKLVWGKDPRSHKEAGGSRDWSRGVWIPVLDSIHWTHHHPEHPCHHTPRFLSSSPLSQTLQSLFSFASPALITSGAFCGVDACVFSCWDTWCISETLKKLWTSGKGCVASQGLLAWRVDGSCMAGDLA